MMATLFDDVPELIRRASNLWGREWSVIPLDYPDGNDTDADPKKPMRVGGHHPNGEPKRLAWTEYQTRRATDEEVFAWFGNGARRNIGIVCGAVSGIVAVDFDSADAEAAWRRSGRPLSPMQIRTAKGKHVIFRHPGTPVPNKARIIIDGQMIAADVRGDGGYIVGPGSVHASGVIYDWISGADLCVDDLPVFDVRWIAPPDPPRPASPPRPARPVERDAVLRRARRYLDAVPPAVEGQGGDAHTYRVACILTHDFGLSAGDAYDLLRDWNQSCVPPWSDRELEQKIANALKYGSGAFGTKADAPPRRITTDGMRRDARPDNGDGTMLPDIDAGDRDLARSTAAAWTAIQQGNDPPFLFRHGDIISRVEVTDTGALVLRPVTPDTMRHVLARVARWFTAAKKTQGQVDALPPLHVVKDVLAHPDPPLPVTDGIVEVPQFAPDGSLHDAPGYHAATRMIYEPASGFRVPTVATTPSPTDIEDARDLLLTDLLGDFPFVSHADRAHALAATLLMFVRHLIDGPTPLHALNKPTPGTGAGLLTDVITTVALGRAASVMTEAVGEDEWRKRITATLMEGPSCVLLDNVSRVLDSAALSAVLTATVWKDRMMGVSRNVQVPVRCLWLATGNNLRFSAEMTRRTLPITLDARVERPWERSGFRHPNLRDFAADHRGELVWAALTLVRAWLAQGRPLRTDVTFGSFEAWARTMGGILTVVGVPGFLSNLPTFYADADTESAAAKAFVSRWRAAHGGAKVGVAALFPLVSDPDPLDLGLGDAKSEKGEQMRLGKWLARKKDRIYDGYRIAAAGTYQGAQQWRLVGDSDGDDDPNTPS